MYGILVTFFALLAVIATSRPLATNPGFQISRLFMWEIQGHNTTITFNILDPDPLTNGTGVCSGSWKTGSGGYPQDSYKQCGNTTFAWNMASYDNTESYTLGLEHVFVDPS
ncbi:hypothetical protein LTR86_006364 [Recurvomyces mirabilis]|nr:hypothetical protein LTR86_006364 [Recurvomyces mirabilis]